MKRSTKRPSDRVRVLLLWPGGLFGGGANFGVPQLLSIAGVLLRDGDAIVDVVDFDLERAFGPVDLAPDKSDADETPDLALDVQPAD